MSSVVTRGRSWVGEHAVLLFALLVLQFGSYRRPAIIGLTIPLILIGAINVGLGVLCAGSRRGALCFEPCPVSFGFH